MIENPDGYTLVDAPSMATRTTMRVGGEALAEIRFSKTGALEKLPALLEKMGGRLSIMGEGSNILAKDGKLPLTLVSLAPTEQPHVVEERAHSVLLRVAAGVRLPSLLAHTGTMGLSGLEGLCGIPGNVGGALIMNAGSYGTTFSAYVRSVQLFSPHWGLVERPVEDFSFSYRTCRLKNHTGWYVVTAATLELGKSEKTAVRSAMRDVYAKKQATQPVTAWSAGCVFKNPAAEASAGKLLDAAGMRGVSLGDMRFSHMHANFLVNEGQGTFRQAHELITMAREKVRAHSGHALELEVQIWP